MKEEMVRFHPKKSGGKGGGGDEAYLCQRPWNEHDEQVNSELLF